MDIQSGDQRVASLHWVAGLYEGEGSCGFTARVLRLQLAMTDEDVVRRFHEACRVGRVNGPYLNKGDNNKPHWQWAASGSQAYGLAMMLWPLLGERRREQVDRAVRLWLAQPRRTLLSQWAVDEICRRFALGNVTQGELAADFGVSDAHVCKILSGQTRRSSFGPVTPATRDCPQCGNPFVPRTRRVQTFCTARCQRAASEARTRGSHV